MHDQLLSSKVALVTGGARRIGADIVKCLHAAGMRIVLHYHASKEAAEALSEQLNKLRPDSVRILSKELSDDESAKDLIKRAESAWGRLDVLVNNASRFYRTRIGEVTEYAWNDLMNSNVKIPFFLAQAARPTLAANKGVIVNITDIHAERPLLDYSAYCISKASLWMATKVLAKELGPDIRVNAVAPGSIIWPEGDNVLVDDEKQRIVKKTALKRAGDGNDIARAVLYFVRDATYVTGQVLNVDGGRTLT